MPSQSYETLSGEIIRVTDKAVLFENDANGQQTWVPRSVCLDGDALNVGDTDVIIKTRWLENLT